ncbi:sugar ABC transporter ATP-binding protein [Streptomyces canus]|uniref:sugar ABC transporter ATP-binding protein n=1 Tax=Streptomyces canus TaxID=58343 RepID=UPI00367EBA43
MGAGTSETQSSASAHRTEPSTSTLDPADAPPHVQALSITKHFAGSPALTDVDLTIGRDTFHAFVGENGAGKSTLGRIIAGFHRPSGGQLKINGEVVRFRGPRDALAHGITMVVQERTVAPNLSVLDNVLLNREQGPGVLVSRRAGLERFEEVADLAGITLDPYAQVGSLRPAEQLRVELLRAVARDVELLVLDEVTAALAPDEADAFFHLLGELRASNRSIVYVTHFLNEVLQFADEVTILRDGQVVRTSPSAKETPSTLIAGMLGRPLDSLYPDRGDPLTQSEAVLSVRDLRPRGASQGISFDIKPGEILGLAGLVGSGRTEIARAIFGADRPDGGEIQVDGATVHIRSPKDAIRHGVAMIPESRQHDGLVLGRAVGENITLAHLDKVSRWGWVRRSKERRLVRSLIEQFDVRTRSAGLPVGALSGGNQQKALFAKWFLHKPRVLIADEPTRGVDVGAKHAIYELLTELAREGAAILLISSEIEEVLGLAHRVLVIRNGGVVSEFEAHLSGREAVLRAAFGQLDHESGTETRREPR